MIKSTVVIPNYNGIKYIQACLESLYDGTTKDLAVIVVDNASTDGSMELVREHFPQVQLIVNQQNTGFSHAVNQGIKASTTPYVILLNNDTQADFSFVHELEKVMDSDQNKKIFSASAKLVCLYDKDRIDDAGDYYCALGWAYARGKGKESNKYTRNCDIFAACAGAAIYRRELLEENQVGLFDEEHFAYFEDIDIGYRAKIYGYRNKFAANSIVYHAGSATSGSRYNTFKTGLASRNSIYLIYKNMPVLQIVLNLPFLIMGFSIKTLFFVRKGMGRDYVSGLWRGVKLSMSPAGKRHRQKFDKGRFVNYVSIQLELWRNLVRLFV
ncbi:MAG: glycosyltransferase family 2 protein [Lachnospiraceae bacterium]|nr:glycosyltransferase family 2 protein [Lachnospiraceae bacterium]